MTVPVMAPVDIVSRPGHVAPVVALGVGLWLSGDLQVWLHMGPPE